MILAITIMATKFNILKQHWEKNSSLEAQGKVGTNTSLGKDVGGAFLLFDWEKKEIIQIVDLKNPMGVACDGSNFYIACLVEDNIAVLDKDLREIKRITNPLFNVPHSIELDEDNILVANTGLDEAIKVDHDGNQISYWSALENGFDTDQFGNNRVVDRSKKHTDITYPTLTQATHLNYYNFIDGYYYITLFHQGIIVRSPDGKNYTKILDGLNHPHAIRKCSDGFIVSDTKNNSVNIYDSNFEKIDEIKLNFDWVQDAFQAKNGNYIVIDSNNGRIVEVNANKEICSEWKVSDEWRLFQAIELK